MSAASLTTDAPASSPAPDPKPGRFGLTRWRFNDEPRSKVAQTGGCHCGAVPFRIQHEPLTKQAGFHIPVKMCNCSICARNGYFLIYPLRTELEWLQGGGDDGTMTDYRFATGNKAHRFCARCGSSICLDPEGSWNSWAGDVVGINVSLPRYTVGTVANFIQVRMLDDWGIADLNFHEKNGKNFYPQ